MYKFTFDINLIKNFLDKGTSPMHYYNSITLRFKCADIFQDLVLEILRDHGITAILDNDDRF
ncbi:hypothetical protein C900_05212 [Fulvivirga imtechensis AK7]|uniref:Uncharacterized protein n=1 Tax=Fulvivirga imtechensis AK7 TaxID=1237149 RepID=L8JYA7_9BACT|nr:hypothetical protein C900_05212 [Fulvivirga imtechensis AK7]